MMRLCGRSSPNDYSLEITTFQPEGLHKCSIKTCQPKKGAVQTVVPDGTEHICRYGNLHESQFNLHIDYV